MLNLWELIESIVDASYLNEEEKENVKVKLDETIGSNFLEYKLPYDPDGLNEDEVLIYKEIIAVLNEKRTFPKVRNDFQYQKVVKEIFAAVNNKPDKKLQNHLIQMDEYFEDGDWNSVNDELKRISKLL